jgi:hypothetical protein
VRGIGAGSLAEREHALTGKGSSSNGSSAGLEARSGPEGGPEGMGVHGEGDVSGRKEGKRGEGRGGRLRAM